mgnify:CR=1 FL=1
MRKLLSLLLVLISLVSCEDLFTTKDGDWPPIKVDKSRLSFTPEGGSETVTLKNYSSWWIYGAHEGAYQDENGAWRYENYIYPTPENEDDLDAWFSIDGGWYHASVPDRGRSKSLIVTVNANYSREERKAFIEMECGDAFTSISISQEASERNVDIIVEWAYEGWDDLYNKLEGPVTITTLYTKDASWEQDKNAVPHEIAPGEYIRLNAGSFIHGESIREHPFLKVELPGGKTMLLASGGYEAWNKYFFDRYSERKVTENVDVGGTMVTHSFYTRVYWIDEELVKLWDTADSQ